MNTIVTRKAIILRVIVLVMVLYSLTAVPFAQQAVSDTQIAQAKQFLLSVSKLELSTARALLPTDAKNFFGPCDFTALPSFSGAIARGDQGILYWKGSTKDPQLPDSGALLFRKLPRNQGGAWKVRQICYHADMPKLLLLFLSGKNESRSDHQAKAVIIALGKRYVTAWLNSDYATMKANWYDWTIKNTKDDKPVSLTITSAATSTNHFNEPVVKLKVHIVKRIAFVSFTGDYWCSFVVVNEHQQWKVRGSSIEFYK